MPKSNPTLSQVRVVATCATPAVAALVVGGLFELFMSVANIQAKLDCDLSSLRAPEGFHARTAAVLAQIAWGVSSELFVLVWLTVTLAALWLLSTSAGGTSERWRPPIAVLGVLISAWVLSSQSRALTISGLVPVFDASFKALELEHGKLVFGLFPALALAGATLLILAACTTLVPGRPGQDPAEHLRTQVLRLKMILYLGAALLVAGTVQNAAMHELPSALATGEQAEDLRKIARAVSAGTGTFWTFLLAAMYLPCAVVLRGRADELARRANPASSPAVQDEWLSSRSLQVSFGEGLRHVLAMLSPLLAGLPTSMALKALTG